MYRIKGIHDLAMFARHNKKLFCPSHPKLRKPKAASFFIHMQALKLYGLIKDGLYIYQEPKKTKRTWMTSTLKKRCSKCYRVIMSGERYLFNKVATCHLCGGYNGRKQGS